MNSTKLTIGFVEKVAFIPVVVGETFVINASQQIDRLFKTQIMRLCPAAGDVRCF
ncbi:MAG: hypothetical protein RH917_18160 [Lacipirellulaceae bacterium]